MQAMRSSGLGVALMVALVAMAAWQELGLEPDWDEREGFADLLTPVEGTLALEELEAHEHGRFLESFWDVKPCIIRGATRSNNSLFAQATKRGALVREFGAAELVLSTANTASYAKRRMRLSEYVRTMMGPQDERASGEDTWYQFGDQTADLARLMAQYELPDRTTWMQRVNNSALSFGLSGTGTGVPFHTHGEKDLSSCLALRLLCDAKSLFRLIQTTASLPRGGHDDLRYNPTLTLSLFLSLFSLWWSCSFLKLVCEQAPFLQRCFGDASGGS